MQSETVQPKSRSWLWVIIFGRSPRRTAIRIVVLIVTAVITFKYVIRPVRVSGPSMLPTFQENSIKFVNRLAYSRNDPQRGDVVAIRFTGESIMLVKRVVALPGERVEFINGKLHVNHRAQDEPYIKRSCYWNFVPEHPILGPDEYYVVGDNRSMREEDHTKGVARRGKIVGKVL